MPIDFTSPPSEIHHHYPLTCLWQDSTADVRRRTPVSFVLRHIVRWRIRGRRADCGLCQADHSQHGTVSFNDAKGVWHCHRCDAGGSVFDLIMSVRQCDFLTALKFLATEARIELPCDKKLSVAERARLHREAAERRKREAELDAAYDQFVARERTLRLHCRQQIHDCDKVLYKSEPWSEQDWSRAKAAFTLRQILLVEYSLFAFGSLEQRMFYVVGDVDERNRILAEVSRTGVVVDGAGRWMEVLQ